MAGIRLKPVPYCRKCGGQMALRRPGPKDNWRPFWGCKGYPDCRGARSILSDGLPEGISAWGKQYDE
jgi:ssDNA-binding Zn-finger/Zn-ribbon topoisomerase 1